MVNVLPDLRRRISRQELEDLIANLRDEAEKVKEKEFNIEKFKQLL